MQQNNHKKIIELEKKTKKIFIWIIRKFHKDIYKVVCNKWKNYSYLVSIVFEWIIYYIHYCDLITKFNNLPKKLLNLISWNENLILLRKIML